jgi:hypothetical protein
MGHEKARASAGFVKKSGCKIRLFSGRYRALNAPFDSLRFGHQFTVQRAEQKSVKAAFLFDRADCAGGNAHPHGFAKRIAQQRGPLQIGQKTAACPVIRMAHIIASLNALSGDDAASRHDRSLPC